MLGALLGIAAVALLSRWMAAPWSLTPYLVAPIGATAVIIFAAPASPMGQPWAAIVGNTVSAVAGVVCARLIGDIALAAGAATGLAVAFMLILRCLHPPGGAVAVTAVLLHATSFQFAFFPVFVTTTLVVLAACAWHRATGHRYPHGQLTTRVEIGSRFTAADFDAALAHYDGVLDVSRDDLLGLLQQAGVSSYRRRVGDLRCSDIMSRDLQTVRPATSIAQAWEAMQRYHVKALPVVDRTGAIAGIVTRADFLRETGVDPLEGTGVNARMMAGAGAPQRPGRPAAVGQIMTRRVRVAREDRHVVDLIAAFSEEGHHHLPVVDLQGKAVGMITQSDVVRALARAL
ncbi:CBS domain-containing membrane protein [Panacagrimonas perspica]|uniref:CBS domain-containing membrane protein n=2 Tax=Panacagrimonas perspica TaxID=381431 RepID=A0A4V3F685_9GAMM|nr:CBS domain-containing membrane protein [Panacagrimonas perspica]